MKTRQKIRKGIILFSFFLFPAFFYYLSPALIIQASAQGIINGSFILFGFMFVSSLFLGRAYCGWVCPGAGCQEAIFSVRDKKVKRGNRVKWLIWTPWICTIIILTTRAGGYKKIDFFYQTTMGLSIGDVQGLIAYLSVLILLIVLPAFILGKRSFCHHLCWMAPFMILGRKIRNLFKWPALQLRANPELCTHCHSCVEQCPMSLPVEGMVTRADMENDECILCGSCIDGCKQGAIQYRFK
jgi:ferredoxin-type protein NapH